MAAVATEVAMAADTVVGMAVHQEVLEAVAEDVVVDAVEAVVAAAAVAPSSPTELDTTLWTGTRALFFTRKNSHFYCFASL